MAAVTDIRVQTNWRHHPKRKKLQKRLGAEGVLAVMDLWLWIGDTRPTGDLRGMDPDDIAVAADWSGDSMEFVQALLDIGLLDELEDGGLAVHDWEERNPWAFGAERRSEQARKAGKRSGEIRSGSTRNRSTRTNRSTESPNQFNSSSDSVQLNRPISSTPVPVPPPVPSPSPVRTSQGRAPDVDEVLPDNSEDARARSQQPGIARAIAEPVPPDQPPERGALTIVNDAWYRWQRKDIAGRARVIVDERLRLRVPPEHIAECIDAIARADRDGRIRQSPAECLARLIDETPVGAQIIEFRGDSTPAQRRGDLGLEGLRQVKDALGRKDADAAASSGADPPKTGRALVPADGPNRTSSSTRSR